MDIIHCYPSRSNSEEEEKDTFYYRLLTILQDKPRNILIIMSNFMPRLTVTPEYVRTSGQGLGEMNNNLESFANMCDTINLIIRGTVFPHK